jgi:hypothetical protein
MAFKKAVVFFQAYGFISVLTFLFTSNNFHLFSGSVLRIRHCHDDFFLPLGSALHRGRCLGSGCKHRPDGRAGTLQKEEKMEILTTSELTGRSEIELKVLFAEISKAMAKSEAVRRNHFASLQNISRAISAVRAQNFKL